jgi:hypothetical protein
MDKQASPLKRFTKTLIGFFEMLSDSYPEERDIRLATDGLKAIDSANPRILLTMFMKNIYPTFREPVLTKNEEVLISLGRDVLQNKFSEMSYAFWIFDKHWKTMSEPDKDKIWKWCTALVLLSERASASP